MKTRVLLLAAFMLAACNDDSRMRHTPKPTEDTPAALAQQGSFNFSLKRGYEDLVEDLYKDLVTKDGQLKALEDKIQALHQSEDDSTAAFDQYNGKIQMYFSAAANHVAEIADTVLREKMRVVVAEHLAKYNATIAKDIVLEKTIEAKRWTIADMHKVLMIVRTLPVIEKYAKDNHPGTKPLEGFIQEQDKAIHLADTLIKK